MISLDKPIGSSGEDSRKLYEVIPDESDSPLEEMITDSMRQIVIDALKDLSPREEKVIRLRFGLSASPTDHNNFPITNDELTKLEERANANA